MESTEWFGSVSDAERTWLVVAVLALVGLVGGSAAFPRLVYDRFIWQYFWGPVYADANNAACAVRDGGVRLLTTDACSQAEAAGSIVARPGYTLVSEAGYALTLVFMLAGVLFLLRRLDVGSDRELFFSLVPFMFFGGALRVVEDANDAAAAAPGIEQAIQYPLNTLIISPIIYFVVFVVTLAALVLAVTLDRRGVIERYDYLLGGIGAVVLVATVGYIASLVLGGVGPVQENAGFYPQISLIVLTLSALITGAVYVGIERVTPWVNEGTRRIGAVILFGHSLDGVANVVAADWATALGLSANYGAKHPVNQFIIDATSQVLPQSLINSIGTAWPFLLVKVIAAIAVVAIFDEQIFEESPRYAILLLVAILAVGLGPGTRDMLRATFGI